MMVVVPLPQTIESVLEAVPTRVRFARVGETACCRQGPEPVATTLRPFQLVFPRNVAPAPDIVSTAVFVVIVRFVAMTSHEAEAPVTVIALAPIVSVRVFELEELSDPHEHVCPFVFNVPAVNVTAPLTVEPAECVNVKSDLLIVIVEEAAPVA